MILSDLVRNWIGSETTVVKARAAAAATAPVPQAKVSSSTPRSYVRILNVWIVDATGDTKFTLTP